MPIYRTPLPANLTKLPGFAVRVTDATVYAGILAAFRMDPGLPVVIGMSPQEMAAQVGCRITGDSLDGYNTTYENWMAVPCVIVPTLLFDGTVAPPQDQGSGTLPNGQLWAWQCSVEFYVGGVLPTSPARFSLKCGAYVGTGVNGKAVNVGFDMSTASAHVSTWVKPLSGSGALGEWRTSAMVGGSLPTQGQALDADGITAFTATGFTLGTNTRCNQNGVTYGYVAMIDTAGTYMRVGTYIGVGNIGSGNVTATNTTGGCGPGIDGAKFLTGAGFNPNWRGCVIDFVTKQYTITNATAVRLDISPCWTDPTITTAGTILGINRSIFTGTDSIAFDPTHVWSDGFGGGIYKSTNQPDPNSVILPLTAINPRPNSIVALTAQGGNGFRINGDDSVNRDGKTYYWMAIKSTAAFALAALQSGRFVAAGSDPITGLPWQPGWATTQQEANNTIAVWRAQGAQAGTDSTGWGADGGGNTVDFPANGIASFTAGGFTTGAGATPAGKTIDWFAFKGTAAILDVPSGPLVGTCPVVVGVVHLPYCDRVAVVGGTAPYTFNLIYGALPPGLVLNPVTGVISGIPTTAGDYAYIIRIMDATGDPAIASSVSCTLTVNPSSNTPRPPDPDPQPGVACRTDGMNAATADVSACRTEGMVTGV